MAYLGEDETVRVITRFDGTGKYMMHCHNLVHEDHDMMVQFEVIDPNHAGVDPLGPAPKERRWRRTTRCKQHAGRRPHRRADRTGVIPATRLTAIALASVTAGVHAVLIAQQAEHLVGIRRADRRDRVVLAAVAIGLAVRPTTGVITASDRRRRSPARCCT